MPDRVSPAHLTENGFRFTDAWNDIKNMAGLCRMTLLQKKTLEHLFSLVPGPTC